MTHVKAFRHGRSWRSVKLTPVPGESPAAHLDAIYLL
jgi:hypothetical protein